MKWSARGYVTDTRQKSLEQAAGMPQVRNGVPTVKSLFIGDGKYCPCCDYVLRTKPRGTETRKRLLEKLEIKRI